jgi:hypothetical protein
MNAKEELPLLPDMYLPFRDTSTQEKKFHFLNFFQKMIVATAGKKVWTAKAKVSNTISGSGLITPSDEAFTLLCLENYWAKWLPHLAEGDEKKDEESKEGKNDEEEDEDDEDDDNDKKEKSVDGSGQESDDLGTPRKKATQSTGSLRRITLNSNSSTGNSKKISLTKWTDSRRGHYQFGGWDDAGLTRFNELFTQSRASRISKTGRLAEDAFLNHCQLIYGLDGELGKFVSKNALHRDFVEVFDDFDDDVPPNNDSEQLETVPSSR